jgi:hypothetical protein
MNMPHSVAQLQAENVTLELECIDRMYLNCYVPQLTSAAGVASYFRNYKGHRFASTKEAVETSEAFRRNVFDFAKRQDIPVHRFAKGERKDDVMHGFLKDFREEQGVVFIGIAQEKATVPRTIRKRFGDGKGTIPWIDYTTAMVNFYYFYCVDEDLGPFFLKFCSYFPYGGKLCINGHEYLKCQLAKRGIAFEALDNGLLTCAEPTTAQSIADGFNEHRIERFFRKWLKLLPHPFPAADRKAGYLYQLSVLQAEFALTQVWDRPVHGREFFEQVIRDNIDLGRPEKVQLIFARKMRKATATDGRCRTRVITEGVIPSLHVYYKNTHLKQYHKTWKKGAALRTETTINNSYDFGVGRIIRNLPLLRDIGFAANRRVLEVETVSHDNRVGAQAFDTLQKPVTNDEGQRASALRFGDARVQALFAVLILLSLQIEGFHNRLMRPLLARMLGLEEDRITQGRMTYDLRRLRLHGLIERIEKTHRYRLTRKGLGVAFIYQRTYLRLLRPALSAIDGDAVPGSAAEAKMLQQIQSAIDNFISSQAA